MGLPSLAGRLALPILLGALALAPGDIRARPRDRIAPAVRDWISGVVTKIGETDRGRVRGSRGGASGTVTIRVRIAADGSVDRVEIERSSGSPDLDRRARTAARDAGPFRPPPASLLTAAGSTELSFPVSLAP